MQQMKTDHELERLGKERNRKEAANLKQLASHANAEGQEYDNKLEEQRKQQRNSVLGAEVKDNSRKAFYREFKRVVEESDVLLEVLDARDPMGCRAKAVEAAILEKGGKKIVLVLNKIDLVPQEVVTQWLTYLRHEFPTVAFRCNTQTQKNRLARTKGDFDTMDALDGAACLGGDNLLELLKNYCRSQSLKKSITVGIIGYPNTGKSSLINSLCRSKVAPEGARPGFTRTVQEIKLDKDVILLDCPGIVFSNTEENSADIVLRNAVEMEKIADPVPVVDAVLRRCPRERLMELYQIPVYRSSEEFLAHVSHKIGRLKKGGIPDYRAAAISVLRDWQTGKIKFFTLPPERTEAVLASEVVTTWAKEFDLDSIVKRERENLVPKLKTRSQLQDGLMQVAPVTHGTGEEFVRSALRDTGLDEDDEDDDDDDLPDADDDDDENDDEMDDDAGMVEDDSGDDDGEADPYAAVSNTQGGRRVIQVATNKAAAPSKPEKKRTSTVGEVAENGGDDYEAPIGLASRKKNLKKHKQQQKKKTVVRGPMDEDSGEAYVEEPYNFDDDFVMAATSEKKPEANDDDFEFRY